MASQSALPLRDDRHRSLIAAVAVFCLAGGLSGLSFAQSPDRIVRVEEDWELVVSAPDPASDGPQITCATSPTGGVNGLHVVLEINHRSQPSFSAGGIQMQVWNGESLITTRTLENRGEMNTPGETVRWTQTMTLSGSNVVFEVVNGSSVTWGSSGGIGFLKAIIAATLTDLNAYHPDISTENSGVGFAGNRVQSLVLREVRLITADGAVLRDSTRRVVHEQ